MKYPIYENKLREEVKKKGWKEFEIKCEKVEDREKLYDYEFMGLKDNNPWKPFEISSFNKTFKYNEIDEVFFIFAQEAISLNKLEENGETIELRGHYVIIPANNDVTLKSYEELRFIITVA